MTKRSSKIRLLATHMLFSLNIGLILYPHPAQSSSVALIHIQALQGVDTIAVSDNFGPEAEKLLKVDHRDTRPIVLGALQEVFGDANNHLRVKDTWLAIRPYHSMDINDLLKPNVLQMSFVISARQENIDGKAVTVAALSVTLRRQKAEADILEISGDATYPFVVTNKNELATRMTEGVKFLTSFLPSYLVCANKYKYGHKSEQCPDCDISACNIDKPYGEE